MKSASQHSFAVTPSVKIGRSAFRRPCTHKTTMDAGKLYPVYLEETLPGDTVNFSMTVFARMMTLICPIMDNLKMDLHAWYCPNRILMDKWDRVLGADDEYDADRPPEVYQVPALEVSPDSPTKKITTGSLADYFGLPVGVDCSNSKVLRFSILPFRMYNLVWNEFYRDENLQQKVYFERGFYDGITPYYYDESKYLVLPRGKRKDQFSGALPWPQKGPGVELPLGRTAPVFPDGNNLMPRFVKHTGSSISDTIVAGDNNNDLFFNTTTGSSGVKSLEWATGVLANGAPKTGLYADLSNASAVTINQMREAFQLQLLYERDALGGTRINELILSHFSVRVPDARLQRPEYLGGVTLPVNIHTVVQNSSTDNTSPQGHLTAYGTTSGLKCLRFTKSFVEHGWIMVLASIRADLTYQQGIDKKWSHFDRFDFYWPVFAHLGEVAVENQELFASGDYTQDHQAFGFQERWYEYRYSKSLITGLFRSAAVGSLDAWHLSQNFASLPVLNASFIEENPPISRVVAVPSQPAFLFDSLVDSIWVRPMPMYSVPGRIDHFV